MELNKLPPKLRELAILRCRQTYPNTYEDRILSGNINVMIDWLCSPEGHNFWKGIHNAKKLSDLPIEYQETKQLFKIFN